MVYDPSTKMRRIDAAPHVIVASLDPLGLIASQFVGQTLQERAGEKEMMYGINQVIEARRKAQEYRKAKHPAKIGRKKKQKPK